jgi:hypothetical protein
MKRKRFPNDRSLPDDTPAMAKAIATLKDHDIPFIRTSRFQLKIDEWNFYPDRGTIVRDDGSAAETDRGLDALLARIGCEGGRLASDPKSGKKSRYRKPTPEVIDFAALCRPLPPKTG